MVHSIFFEKYSNEKGEEYFIYFEIVLVLSYIFFIMFHFFVRRIKLANLIFIPFIIFVGCISIGIAIVLNLGDDASPTQDFWVYLILNLLVTYGILKSFLAKELQQNK